MDRARPGTWIVFGLYEGVRLGAKLGAEGGTLNVWTGVRWGDQGGLRFRFLRPTKQWQMEVPREHRSSILALVATTRGRVRGERNEFIQQITNETLTKRLSIVPSEGTRRVVQPRKNKAAGKETLSSPFTSMPLKTRKSHLTYLDGLVELAAGRGIGS